MMGWRRVCRSQVRARSMYDNTRGAVVLSAFFRLSDHDKLEVSQIIERYLTTGVPLRQGMVEQISIIFHPPPYGCPICGR